MKPFIATFLIVALMSGCTLVGVRSGNVQETPRQPDVVESTDEHLGDPTFERETVEQDGIAGYKRDVPKDAVVTRERSAPPPSHDADLAAGLDLHQQGKLREARKRLTAALDNNISADNETKALTALRAINEKIFLSAGPDGDLKVYRIQNGDSLEKIGKSVGTNWEALVRLNGMSERDIKALQIGHTIKVPNGTFELKVRKSKFVMDLLLNGQFIQRYEVGLGVGGCTPVGEFKVKNRIPEPADGSYPFGHEKHRLGTRWLGLAGERGYNGYGIHGCRADEQREIPGACSQGCVRMKNTDVEEVFDIVPVGTRVVIVE
jgi:LysM repeat protein